MQDKNKRDFREDLTNKIIKQIEAGTAPWQKSWKGGTTPLPLPHNPTTNRRYHGGNVMGLMMQGYSDPRWCTYKQATEMGWQVQKGEKGTTIEYWKVSEEKTEINEKGEKKNITVKLEQPLVFYATVFNAEQMKNVPPLEVPKRDASWNPVESAEKILRESKATIQHMDQDRAYYAPSRDEIVLPPKTAFPDAPKYYATALHELGHWTGHSTRLNRDLSGSFGSEKYAREELRAEMASLFLSAELGLLFDPSRHASYQASWIQALKNDKHEIFRAARDAETITDYVMGLGLEKELEKNQTQTKDQKIGKNLTDDEIFHAAINSKTITDYVKALGVEKEFEEVQAKTQNKETSNNLTSAVIATDLTAKKRASLNAATQQIKEGLDAKGLDGKFKVIEVGDTNSLKAGNKFTGEISVVTDLHVVQKVGANKYVAHERANLPADEKYDVGKSHTLQYSQGKARIVERGAHQKTPDKSLSR